MSAPSSCEQLAELLAPYALHAVDPEEASLVEAHLSGCPRCRSELAHYLESAGALGASVDLEQPPAALWERIARDISETPRHRDPSRERPHLASLVGDRAPGKVDSSSSENGGTGALRRLTRSRYLWPASAAALAIVVALLGLRLAGGPGTGHGPGGQSANLAAVVQRALDSPGHETVSLLAPSGQRLASVVTLPDGQAYLTDAHMAALPPDETYQLWAVIKGKAISVGLLGPTPVEAAFTVAPGARASSLAVTVEPAGGVTAPDRAPVATAVLEH